MDLSATQEIPDLEVTDIRRRRDGLFLICSHGETALSLTERQMKIVLAVCSEDSGDEIRSGLRDIVFRRPRMKLKHPAKKIYRMCQASEIDPYRVGDAIRIKPDALDDIKQPAARRVAKWV